MSDCTDRANMALHAIAKSADGQMIADGFIASYLLGQVSIIEIYFEPDADLVAKAHAAVKTLRARIGEKK